MKTIRLYEVFAGDKLKFSSIDRLEVEDYCQVLYDATGILATIQDSDYTPVDHTKKTQPKKTTGFIKHGHDNKEIVEETYKH